MPKKLKTLFNRIELYAVLFFTLILFLLISYLIFTNFKDAKVFTNNLFNLITKTIFFSAIYIFIINLYYKIFKIVLTKPLFSEKEFRKLWKKRRKIAQEIINKKIKYNSKEYKEKFIRIEEINKKLDKSSVKFKNWFTFFTFSLYFGILKGMPIDAIKHSIKYFWVATKDLFSTKSHETGFVWYKLKNEMYIIESFIYQIRKIIKIK